MFKKIAIAIIIAAFMFLVVVGFIMLFSGKAFAMNYVKDGVLYKNVHIVTVVNTDHKSLNEALEEWTNKPEHSKYFIIEAGMESPGWVFIIYSETGPTGLSPYNL